MNRVEFIELHTSSGERLTVKPEGISFIEEREYDDKPASDVWLGGYRITVAETVDEILALLCEKGIEVYMRKAGKKDY